MIFSTIGTVNSENTDGINNRICCSELYCLSGRKGITEAKDLGWVELSDTPGCRRGIQIQWDTGPVTYVIVAEKTWIVTQKTLECWSFPGDWHRFLQGIAQKAHAPLRGLGINPRYHPYWVGKGDSASALPHHLPFQVCFERAFRCLVFAGLFLVNNKNDEQNTNRPLTKTCLLQEHVTASSLGEVFTNHMLEKSCRCCFKSTRKARTHQNSYLHTRRGWHQQLRTRHLSRPLVSQRKWVKLSPSLGLFHNMPKEDEWSTSSKTKAQRFCEGDTILLSVANWTRPRRDTVRSMLMRSLPEIHGMRIKVASTGQNVPKNKNHSPLVLWGTKNK